MKFDESLQQYVYQYEDLIFSWDEEPKEEYISKVKVLAKNYKDNLDRTVTYCDQSFDDYHIFSFEFLNNTFEKLEHFSVDG